MGRGIIKLEDDRYLEWSTVVDAPVSASLDRDEAVKAWGEERIARADEKGTSFLDVTESAANYVRLNRAGPGETCLTMEQICKGYKPGGEYVK